MLPRRLAPALLVLTLAAGGCTPSSPGAGPGRHPTARATAITPIPPRRRMPRPQPVPPPSGSALAALALLPVRPAGSARGYSRERFGTPYGDTLSPTLASARNGCDQRSDVRRRDGHLVVIRPGSHGCVVTSAFFVDPYTGRELAMSDTELEHVVSLKNAWISGARDLTDEQRADIAGDPLNLLIVGASVNASKGEKSAATWLPPAAGYRCAFVARQVAVKTRYRLAVTQAEHDAMAGVLGGCPAQPMPTAAEVDPPAPADPGDPGDPGDPATRRPRPQGRPTH